MSKKSLKNLLWPIQAGESSLFLPMAFMFMLIIFNSYILSSIKDSLIVINSGPETLTFVRAYLVLPASILFFMIYTKMLNTFKQSTIFYIITISFILFFLAFIFYIYPNHEVLHPKETAEKLLKIVPQGLVGLVAIYQYWTFSLFYVFAELWTVVMVGILFWQFANSVVPIDMAKRFYSHFQLFANLGVIVAGHITMVVSDMYKTELVNESFKWFISQQYLIITVVASSLVIMLLYHISSKNIIDRGLRKDNNEKLSIPFFKSMKLVFSSRVLFLMTFLIISYGLCNNIIEVCWKNYVKTLYSSANDYNSFNGLWTMWIGIITVFTILLGGTITRHLGLRKSAFILPTTIGVLSCTFFALIMLRGNHFVPEALLLQIIVYMGLVQVVLIKGAKYALFDPIKEMMYIPMNKEFRAKGKAAVDALGNRIGKASGGVLQQILFVLVGPISILTPYLAVLILIIVILWWVSAGKLNHIYAKQEGIEFEKE